MTDGLPDEVAQVLDALLTRDDPVHRILRQQVAHLSVDSRCACGCGTAYFRMDLQGVVPAPTGPGTVVAAEAQLLTENGECPGEILVFAQDGYVTWLEVCSWSDDIEVTLSAARRWLRPEPCKEQGGPPSPTHGG